MIRLFASDMDGTLLNNAGFISRHTADSIQRLQKCGIEFIVNTGREYRSAKKELDAANITCSMICYSGAVTYDPLGNPYNIASLPKSIAKQILTIFEKHQAFADIATDYGKSSIADPETLLSYYRDEVFPATKLDNKIYFKTPEDFDDMCSHVRYFENCDTLLGSDSPIYKISTTFVNADKIAALRKEIERIPNLHIASTTDTNLEITHEKAQKGYALLQYAKQKSIEEAEILAVGDSENDYSMLSLNLGRTVAMANASDLVKRVCSTETLSNDEDGVAILMDGMITERYFYEMGRRFRNDLAFNV
jgi:Cof subfamily protein (haloacid dehalogenase superfamily)